MPVEFVSSTTVSAADSNTQTLTPAISGNDTLLLSCWLGASSNEPSAVTYAAVGMTELENLDIQADKHMVLHYVVDPAPAQDLVYTFVGGAQTYIMTAAVVSGVDQTNPIAASTSGSGSGATDASYAIASGGSGKVFDFFGDRDSPGDNVTYWTPKGAGQTKFSSNLVTDTDRTFLSASYKNGAASVTMEWEIDGGTGDAYIFTAVALEPSVTGRTRAVKYFHDINDPGGRIYNEVGRVVQPWELEPDNWIRVTGLFLPTSIKYASFTQDPELAYIEEVAYSIRGGLRIKTNRGEMTEVLLARAAGGKTL